MKGMDKTGRGFQYVMNNFPDVSDAKIKEVIFIGPQTRELIQDKQFDEDLNETERNAWLSFKRICKDFLGNHKAENYQDVVQDLLTSYKAVGCNLSLKIHFPLGFFSRKISAKSVTNTVKDFAKILYQGKWTSCMLADYSWTMKMDVPDAKYRRKVGRLYILEESFCLFPKH